MARLTLISITCNKINTITRGGTTITLGGPIELRAPIAADSPMRVWGSQQMQVGEKIDFNTLPLDQQPQPTPINFFNPTRIELWDTGTIFRARKAEASTGEINPWDSAPPVQPLNYLGGDYDLKYVIEANVVELLFAYGIAVIALIIQFFVITFEVLRSFLRLIISPFRRASFDRKD